MRAKRKPREKKMQPRKGYKRRKGVGQPHLKIITEYSHFDFHFLDMWCIEKIIAKYYHFNFQFFVYVVT